MSYYPSNFMAPQRGSFNDVALERAGQRFNVEGATFASHLELQQCRYCYDAEMLILSAARDEELDTENARKLARVLDVPLCILRYNSTDATHSNTIDLTLLYAHGEVNREAQGVQWEAYTRTRAWAHARNRNHECTKPHSFHEEAGGSLEIKTELENINKPVGKDTSTSNTILSSFVRKTRVGNSIQMDHDGVQFAPCGAVTAVVEAASTNKPKRTIMTRARAYELNAMAILVFHYNADEDLSYPIELHAWDRDGTKAEIKNPTRWESLQTALTLAHVAHTNECSACTEDPEQAQEELGAWMESWGTPLVLSA